MQRGNLDFQQLRVRRDGRIAAAEVSRNKGRISLRLSFLVVFLIGTLIALALSLPNDAELGVLMPKPQAQAQETILETPASDARPCSNLSAGDFISPADVIRVRAGSEMDFGGIFVGQIPAECRHRQQFLIRDDGEKLVIQKLVPQTVSVLRD